LKSIYSMQHNEVQPVVRHLRPLRLSLSILGVYWLAAAAPAQQAAPPGSDLDAFAAKRFPQPVRVGDLIRRAVLEPVESRPILGHVVDVVRLANQQLEIVIKYGGLWGFGGRDIAVPAEAMVLLGRELEVLDFTPQALGTFPTFRAGSGAVLGPDEVIQMGLAHPSH
jgi:hypothetical protein